jgi:hypothetical protein
MGRDRISKRLKGEIPVEARIIMICDIYDALNKGLINRRLTINRPGLSRRDVKTMAIFMTRTCCVPSFRYPNL